MFRVALPRMKAAFDDEAVKVALPYMFTVFVVDPENMTPVVAAPSVKPEVSMSDGVVHVPETTGDVVP